MASLGPSSGLEVAKAANAEFFRVKMVPFDPRVNPSWSLTVTASLGLSSGLEDVEQTMPFYPSFKNDCFQDKQAKTSFYVN